MFHVNPVEPGAHIHSSDPFATPQQDRSAARRLRGRLASPVTLWTVSGPSGLTVSSVLVADGDPGRVLGLVDEESDFWDAVSVAKRFAVTPLGFGDQQLADRFAGLMPSPGGLFALGDWIETDFGPVPAGSGTWVGCRLDGERPYGWGLLVEATIESIHLGESPPAPLIHFRGRYRGLDR